MLTNFLFNIFSVRLSTLLLC